MFWRWLETQRAVMTMASEIALDLGIRIESQHKMVDIAIGGRQKNLSMTIAKALTPPPVYEGPYQTVSKLYYPHSLETRGKQMRENVVIAPIPFHEVSNPAGGKTITIGNA